VKNKSYKAKLKPNVIYENQKKYYQYKDEEKDRIIKYSITKCEEISQQQAAARIVNNKKPLFIA